MASSTDEIESTLLRLPGEIRNRIYQFALTSPRLLVADMTTSNNTRPVLYLPPDEDDPEVADHSITLPTTQRACDDQHHSYNQLKLANKQLYRETKGLELRFDNICLVDPTYGAELMYQLMRRLSSFIDRMNSEKRNWLSASAIPVDMRARTEANKLGNRFFDRHGKPFLEKHQDLFAHAFCAYENYMFEYQFGRDLDNNHAVTCRDALRRLVEILVEATVEAMARGLTRLTSRRAVRWIESLSGEGEIKP